MNKLDKIISDAKNQTCSFCSRKTLQCSNFYLNGHKYDGRRFDCKTCKAGYRFLRKNDSNFYIKSANYLLKDFRIQAYYDNVNNKDRYSVTSLKLPRVLVINEHLTLQFPITKSELQDKVDMFITFS